MPLDFGPPGRKLFAVAGNRTNLGVQERILVCLAAESDATEMLESARRNADRFQGEFYVLYFKDKPLSKEKQDCLESNLQHARELGATLHSLTDTDAVTAVLEFASQRGVTQ